MRRVWQRGDAARHPPWERRRTGGRTMRPRGRHRSVELVRRKNAAGLTLGQPSPCSVAITAACTREATSSLRSTCCTWILTVVSAMPSSRAMTLLLAPRAMPRRISCSRGDSCAIGETGGAGLGRRGLPPRRDRRRRACRSFRRRRPTRRASRAGSPRRARRLPSSSAGSRTRRCAAPSPGPARPR